MGNNIEIKAKAHEPDRLRQVLANLCQSTCEVIFQEDVFFHTPKGRLKLRILARDRGELIYSLLRNSRPILLCLPAIRLP